ncbi:hybrid sensor histidine kinase/response regulator [Agrobacterium tumefaciens]|uniref:hybrid sensor histidine kinase/response regulator n=1 Tax=Agrobacterium tumefaciens TaxID=358 RepID=UPI0013AA0D65|nr:ATP-binding protein [Agrobacterium tumefaciens]MRH97982.1 PAS domain-containing protein [Agrobacterium tumefaciens]
MDHKTANEGYRVLIVAPYGRDAESISALLTTHGYRTGVISSASELIPQLDERIGVIIMTQEALAGEMGGFDEVLSNQPIWSDIPFILLAAQSTARSGAKAHAARMQLFDRFNNAVVLERPIGIPSLLSATKSAMRSRQRQFQMRRRLIELEQSREALVASELELRLVADSLPVLIGFIGRDLRYRFANAAYADWFYRPPEDVIGKHVREIVGDEGFAKREDAILRALGGEETRIEMSWPHRDGRQREAEIRYLPRRAKTGEVDGFYIFSIDITDRKQTEHQLEAMVGERTAALTSEMQAREASETALRQSQKMEAVGQLTGGIAHDFNNMLTGVLGALSIIKRRIASGKLDDLDRFIDAASTSAQRAAALTARLLSFSRRQSLDAKPIDVTELLASLDDLLRRSVRENIALRVVAAADLSLAVADANQLENAILNLVINARDAMPDGGQLTVETKAVELDAIYIKTRPGIKPGSYVMVSVSDTGVGMPKELLEKVFDPFFTTKPQGQGTGLGLSMVYGFARQSNGQVRIHSEPGIGTTVSIYLPVGVAPHAAVDDHSDQPVPEGRGQTVLLVEDDPSVRLLILEVLKDLGYEALEAEDSNVAVTILETGQPIDLMVSDVGLPGMNGRQLAEVARQHYPDLPILFVTGYAENAAIRAGFLGTNMAMITKPFVMDVLAEKISEMLPKQS